MRPTLKFLALSATAASLIGLSACSPQQATREKPIEVRALPEGNALETLQAHLPELEALTVRYEQMSVKGEKITSLGQCLEDMSYSNNLRITNMTLRLADIEAVQSGKETIAFTPTATASVKRFHEAFKGVCRDTLHTHTGYRLD